MMRRCVNLVLVFEALEDRADRIEEEDEEEGRGKRKDSGFPARGAES